MKTYGEDKPAKGLGVLFTYTAGHRRDNLVVKMSCATAQRHKGELSSGHSESLKVWVRREEASGKQRLGGR